MIYTTDYKWKPFYYAKDGEAFIYNKIAYSINEFIQVPTSSFTNCPITPHGQYIGSAFHSILIEISDDGDSYRVCMVKS